METPRERLRSVGLFVATLLCMFFAYGGMDALADMDQALGAAAYTGGLMSILLTHELGHYFAARRHGFRVSLPHFIPLPVGFGTLGAIIFLRSRPPNRTALLEMGAAGPLAGAVVSFVMLAIGLRYTGPDIALEPGGMYLIFNDPVAVKLLGSLVLGGAPGRYAELHPLALAGWVGCLLTAINLVPVGQADGGHVVGALLPRQARRLSRLVLVALLLGGLYWPGWAVWGGLALITGAWRNLEVPQRPALSARARWIAAAVALVLALTFMPRPIEVEEGPPLPAGPEGDPQPPE